MKPVDFNKETYIDFNKEINSKDPKFKIGDFVRISKYKNIFAKGCNPNWSEEVFVIKKVKNTVLWILVILKVKKLLERVIKTNCKKQIKKIRTEKRIKRTGDKLYVEGKGYNNLCNSWIDEKKHSINEWIFSRTKIFRKSET